MIVAWSPGFATNAGTTLHQKKAADCERPVTGLVQKAGRTKDRSYDCENNTIFQKKQGKWLIFAKFIKNITHNSTQSLLYPTHI